MAETTDGATDQSPSALVPELADDVLSRGGAALSAEAALARRTAAQRKAQATRIRADAAELRAHRDDDGRQPAPGEVAFILAEDEELAQSVPERHRRHAVVLLQARVVEPAAGRWQPPWVGAGSYGLLVLAGLLGRRVQAADATATEIIGPGDVLHPGDGLQPPVLPAAAEWEIFQPARIAVLDRPVTTRIARWPGLGVALYERLVRRTERLGYLLAVSHLSRIEDRLHAALWCVAASWGTVTRDGIAVPVALTHRTLGEIAGARRPSITLAMSSLRECGRVIRREDGTYLVRGGPPAGAPPLR